MSELQDAATHLVVIGRGRLVADTSVAELIAAASDGRVSLRTNARTQAATRARQRRGHGGGHRFRHTHRLGFTSRAASWLSSPRARLPFSEVSAHQATLEEAYMELTRDQVEFRPSDVGEVDR